MKVGVLTSGGDCPGLNAGIIGVIESLELQGHTPVLLRDGFASLIGDDLRVYEVKQVTDKAHLFRQGGTFIGSSRVDLQESLEKAVHNLNKANIDHIIVFGGDGSLRGGAALSREGVPVCMIPKTIDNDVRATELTIGFSTAIGSGTKLIDNLADTMQSHKSNFIVEVMGRQSGRLALSIAKASYANGCIVGEVPWTFEDVSDRVNMSKGGNIIVVAEGARLPEIDPDASLRECCEHASMRSVSDIIAHQLDHLGARARGVSLGYTLRGGKPNHVDRTLAYACGKLAVETLQSKQSLVITLKDNKLGTTPMNSVDLSAGTLNDSELAEESRLIVGSRS